MTKRYPQQPLSRLIFCWALGCLLCLPLITFSATVYRYQDEQGRWHFTDKKPQHDHEELEVLTRDKKIAQPELVWDTSEERGQRLTAVNPYFAPVQFELWQGTNRLTEWTVDARKKDWVRLNGADVREWKADYEYRYRLGAPTQRGDGLPLRPPVPADGKFRISQSFKGRFSHQQEPNVYAVDIAMNISDHIHAARDGVVVAVKDDYHMGGTDDYFKDKANYIYVLHSDNTYAVYAHILLGSALVEEGQRVKAGEPLANAGTSGYSTGPHLHFVLRVNDGTMAKSIPFKFATDQGSVLPHERMWLRVKQ